MMSSIPIDQSKVRKEELDRELLRTAIIAELDAINLYNQLVSLTEDGRIKGVFYDVTREVKTHVGEFQAMLLMLDKEQAGELDRGREEVQEIISK